MRVKPIIFFLVVGSLASWFVYREVTRVGTPGVINIGQQAPDFTIKGQDGREIKLSDYRGKLVFLNFWATWCKPCVDEMPAMETLKNKFKDRKFQMLAVTVDNRWNEVNEFYKQYNLTIPAYLDPGQRIAKGLYKTTGIPETFLIDGNGFVIQHTWAARWADPQIMAKVESLIQREEARQPTTGDQVSTR